MKRWILALMVIFAAGCDSENTNTYEFTGFWTFSDLPNTCRLDLPDVYGGGDLVFETIVVKVYENEKAMENEEVLVQVKTPCKDGAFTVDGLKRGTYIVNVAAMAEDPTEEIDVDAGDVEMDDEGPEKRAYYESTEVVVVPPKDDEEIEFSMGIGTGSLEVSWKFENGLQCAAEDNQVATVIIDVDGAWNNKSYTSEEIPCEEATWKVKDLRWDIYTVTIEGHDEKGNTTHSGSLESALEIRPGTHIKGSDGIVVLEPIE